MRLGSRAGMDRGSTIPLILGFFLVALLMIGGSIAAADAFVQQRGLQDVCDGAAAAAASAARLDRGVTLGSGAELAFADVENAVAQYLGRDSDRADVHADAALSPDSTTVLLTCTQTSKVAFGAMFGRGAGVKHTVHSSARSPLSG